MKRILFLLSAVIFSSVMLAQAPQGINYQGVARDFTGAAISKTTINAVFTIHSGGPGGSVVFTESTPLTTDTFGLYTHVIGSVNSLSSVNWSGGNMWLQVDINSSTVANVQLQSVPYALYSGSSNGVVSVSSANSSNITTSGTNTVTVDLATMPTVTAGTYGDPTHYPIIDVDQYGRVRTISTQTVTTSGGTMTSLTVGPGLGGAPTTFTNTASIDLPNIMGSSGGTVTTATAIPVITYDQYGRITAIGSSPINGLLPPSGSAGQVLTHNGTVPTWTTLSTPASTVAVNSPIVGDGSTGLPLQMSAANSVADGYLTTADWNNFNNKISAVTPGSGILSTPVSGSTVTVNADNNSPLWNANALQNVNISTASPTNLQVLTYSASSNNWVPMSMSSNTVATSGQITGDGSTGNPVTFAPLPDGHIYIGNTGNAAIANPITGDVAMTNAGVTTVNNLQGQPLNASTPGPGQVLTYTAGNWTPTTLPSSSLPTPSVGSLLYSDNTNTWAASNPTGIFTDGTNLGIGTNTPASKIDIQTSSTALEINSTSSGGGNPVAHITSNDPTGYALKVDANAGAAIAAQSSGPYAITGDVSTFGVGGGNAVVGRLRNTTTSGSAIWGDIDATSSGNAGLFTNTNASSTAATLSVTTNAPGAYNAQFTGGKGVQVDKLQVLNGAGIAGQVLTSDISGNASWAPALGGLSPSLTSGNIFVGNVTNLATGVAMSGDATISNTGALTLANSGVTAGTYPKVTVDSKGRVTSGTSQIVNADITNGTIDLTTKVTNTLTTANGGMGANMTAGAIGAIPYATSTTAYGTLAAGAAGLVLKSNGAGTAPSWQTDNTGGGTVTSITGAGPGLSGTVTASGSISANNTAAIWNANQITSVSVSTVVPTSNQILQYNGSQWAPANANAGTVTSITTNTTLTGGPISTTGTLSLANFGTAGTYGSATTIPQITVDAYGRVQSTNTVAISALSPSLASGNIFVGSAGGVATATVMSGDATLANTGALTLANTAVTAGTYGTATSIPTFSVDSKGRIVSASNNNISASLLPAGANGQMLYNSAGTWTASNTNNLFFNGTNMGIGNPAPSYPFDMSSANATTSMQVVNTGNGSAAAFVNNNAASTAAQVLNVSTNATGSVRGISVSVTGAANTAAAVHATSAGTGNAINAINSGTGNGIFASATGATAYSGNFSGGKGLITDKLTVSTGAAIGAILTSNTASGDAIWSTPSSVVASGGGWTTTGNTGTTASSAAIGSAVNGNFIGTTDAKDFVVASNNLERLRVTSAGNIGVGVIAPATNLHVYNSNPEIRVESSGGAFTAGYGIKTATQQWFIGQENAAAGLLRIKDVTAGVVRMEIEKVNGNVGINKPNPTAQLDVAASTTVTTINALNTSNNGAAGNFQISNAASSAIALSATTDGGSAAFSATTTGGGNAGVFNAVGGISVYARNNSATAATIDAMNGGSSAAGLFATGTGNNSDVVKATSVAGGNSIVGINSGTGGAGLFNITSGTNTVSALQVNTAGSGFSGAFNGGQGLKTDGLTAAIRNVTAPVTLTTTDCFVFVNANVIVTVPSASANVGRVYMIFNPTSGYSISTVAGGGAIVNSSTGANIVPSGGTAGVGIQTTLRIVSDGTNWRTW